MPSNDRQQYLDAYPVFITAALEASRDFYTRYLDFTVAFEATWFLLLTSAGERPVSLAFMHPDHPSTPPSPAPFRGDGAFFTLQVADAAAAYARITARGLTCDLPLRDEPWGQRRFGLLDPAGIWLDIVEQIAPEDGWWDQYKK